MTFTIEFTPIFTWTLEWECICNWPLVRNHNDIVDVVNLSFKINFEPKPYILFHHIYFSKEYQW